MKQVLILSAYGPGGGSDPVLAAFLEELREAGLREGVDVAVEIHHNNILEQQVAFLRDRIEQPLDLVYACGASLMERALDVLEGTRNEPAVVYWGAHVSDGGCLINPYPPGRRAAGVVLAMPLYSHFRQFRLLKAIFPNVRGIYAPFATESAIVQGPVAERYRQGCRETGPAGWIESESLMGGFPGLAKLAAIIDARFFEYPCSDASDLTVALAAIPSAGSLEREAVTSLVVSCVDCCHVEGALEALLSITEQRRLPLIGLNFGRLFPGLGPLFSFENDFVAASRTVGRWAAAMLQDAARPRDFGFIEQKSFQVRYHQDFAEARGFMLPEALRRRVRQDFGPITGIATGNHR